MTMMSIIVAGVVDHRDIYHVAISKGSFLIGASITQMFVEDPISHFRYGATDDDHDPDADDDDDES